jgi:hypothetical protein
MATQTIMLMKRQYQPSYSTKAYPRNGVLTR